MKYFLPALILLGLSFLMFIQCQSSQDAPAEKLRALADTVGFAHTARQMDEVIRRIDEKSGKERQNILKMQNMGSENSWELVICPHDDYSYAGTLYPYVMKNLSAPTIILFGVAHKAKQFGAENQIIFDSYSHWRGPYGEIPVSPVREEIMKELPEGSYQVNDSLQTVEHSVEALLPFMQYYHRSVQIVSILVPYMSYEKMQEIAVPLSEAIAKVAEKHQWTWGKDYAFAISSDGVHYGDEDWGGKNMAPFGADSTGYQAATNKDMTIISECLIDQPDLQRIKRFVQYTVSQEDYREYAWTWCGRYSIPFGLLTAYYLTENSHTKPLMGKMLRYGTSISDKPLPVSDLGMGITAPANIHHWVSYAAIGYTFQ